MKKYIGIFSALVATNCLAANIIVNGDFEQGNVGFQTQYAYAATCGGVGGEGFYSIANRNCYGPGIGGPSGSGLLYFANGAVDTTQYVWRQDISTTAGSRYYFSAKAASGVAQNPPVLMVQVASQACATAATSDFTTVGTITATTTIWQWVESSGFFNSSSANSCLRLMNNNSAASGNDYGLDDIFVDAIYPVNSTVSPVGGGTVSCTATQQLPGGQPNEVLNGGGATCTATVNPGFTFAGWGGACSGTALTCNISNISSAQSVSGNFNSTAVTPPGNGVTGVPTLSEWGVILLSSILLMLGITRSRSKKNGSGPL